MASTNRHKFEVNSQLYCIIIFQIFVEGIFFPEIVFI